MGASDFKSRGIIKRLLIEGDLLLESPAHLGGGDDEDIDMALALDAREDKPIIWGSSLAGALRNYINERYLGFPQSGEDYQVIIDEPGSAANRLLGYQYKEDGSQSWLIISDSLSQKAAIEYRDLVEIDRKTRTAVDEHKFEAELIAAGTIFPLKFELLIPENAEDSDQSGLIETLAIALQGFEQGEIILGAKKSRGWGRCRVKEWRVRAYDCTTARGLIGWLADQHNGFEKIGSSIEALLGVKISSKDEREVCRIDVDFRLISPMMIGSVSDAPNDPDASQLSRRSAKNDNLEFVVSGTGLAGVLRSQTGCILKTIGFSDNAAKFFENDLWGFVEKNSENAWSSRTLIKECALRNVYSRVYSRVRINHFTGGAYPGALFSEAIVIPDEGDNFTLSLQVHNPKEAEIGLLLLAVKEMCKGEVSVGGGNGIGRGYLEGEKIRVNWEQKGLNVEILQKENNQLTISEGPQASLEKLEEFVRVLHHEVAQ